MPDRDVPMSLAVGPGVMPPAPHTEVPVSRAHDAQERPTLVHPSTSQEAQERLPERDASVPHAPDTTERLRHPIETASADWATRRHDPSLRLIAVLVALKSLLTVSIAVGLEVFGPLRMRNWIGLLVERFHWNTDSKFLVWLLGQMNSQSFHLAAAIILVYACVHGAEAFGLWFDQRWASWFGCVGAALYLPFDTLALWHHRNWFAASIVFINVLVVFVLARNIRNMAARRIQIADPPAP